MDENPLEFTKQIWYLVNFGNLVFMIPISSALDTLVLFITLICSSSESFPRCIDLSKNFDNPVSSITWLKLKQKLVGQYIQSREIKRQP
jgi:hypothetical protein